MNIMEKVVNYMYYETNDQGDIIDFQSVYIHRGYVVCFIGSHKEIFFDKVRPSEKNAKLYVSLTLKKINQNEKVS